MNTSTTVHTVVRSLMLAIVTIVALAAVPVPGQVAFAADTITMAFTAEPSENAPTALYELVFTEAFRRLGMEFQYKVYPPARASFMANSGQVDGEPARIMSYGEAHPLFHPSASL